MLKKEEKRRTGIRCLFNPTTGRWVFLGLHGMPFIPVKKPEPRTKAFIFFAAVTLRALDMNNGTSSLGTGQKGISFRINEKLEFKSTLMIAHDVAKGPSWNLIKTTCPGFLRSRP